MRIRNTLPALAFLTITAGCSMTDLPQRQHPVEVIYQGPADEAPTCSDYLFGRSAENSWEPDEVTVECYEPVIGQEAFDAAATTSTTG